MKTDRERARDFATGFLEVAFVFWLFYAGTMFIAHLIEGPDDSDESIWHQSGVDIVTDHRTGCQYLENPVGGIVPRTGTECFPKGTKP